MLVGETSPNTAGDIGKCTNIKETSGCLNCGLTTLDPQGILKRNKPTLGKVSNVAAGEHFIGHMADYYLIIIHVLNSFFFFLIFFLAMEIESSMPGKGSSAGLLAQVFKNSFTYCGGIRGT